MNISVRKYSGNNQIGLVSGFVKLILLGDTFFKPFLPLAMYVEQMNKSYDLLDNCLFTLWHCGSLI